MKEQNIIGTMQLLAACQATPRVRKLVVRSSTAAYGASFRDPGVFTESTPPTLVPRGGFAKDILEIEGYVRGFARRRPDVVTTVLRLAPFIGVGCPGIIKPDGSIERGAQNLPGRWDAGSFNLPGVLKERLPRIGEHETTIIVHNDAVVQGLSETPFMQDVERWGVLTIGTGLGNASFLNRG